jgi:hypothetical protein
MKPRAHNNYPSCTTLGTERLSKLACAAGLATIIAVVFSIRVFAQFAQPIFPLGNNGIDQTAQDAESIDSHAPVKSFGGGFATSIEPGRTTVYIHNKIIGPHGEQRGDHVVSTIRPSALTSEQAADIGGILGINMLSGQPTIHAQATDHQLELIQAVLAPSANDSTLGLAVPVGKTKQIQNDPTAAQWSNLRRSQDDALSIYAGPLPSVKIFGRYFVIVGIVFGTVYLAFAAFSIITGQMRGGSKVIAAAAGLMLLLMGYTIYKIAVMNAFHKHSVDNLGMLSKRLPDHGKSAQANAQLPDTPGLPAQVPSRPLRASRQVLPLSGN